MDKQRIQLSMILYGFVSSNGKIAGSAYVTRERSVVEVSRYKPDGFKAAILTTAATNMAKINRLNS